MNTMTHEQALEFLKAKRDWETTPNSERQALTIAIAIIEKDIRLQKAMEVVKNVNDVVDAITDSLTKTETR